jgi:outer membrane protein assembly factor BamB
MKTIFPTGVTIYDPDRAYNGYFLDIPRMRFGNHEKSLYRSSNMQDDNGVTLRDMNGNIVNSWKTPHTKMCMRAELQPNGDMFVMLKKDRFMLYDWEGNLLESMFPASFGNWGRNDSRVTPEGDIIYLLARDVPEQFLENVEDYPTKWWGVKKRKGVRLNGESIIISDWKGNIKWQWDTWDHLDVNDFSPMTNLDDWTHGNTCRILPENKWYDGGDKRFKPGNILYNPRNLDKITIIDRDTKEIVWTWTHDERGGLSHCHEPVMIEKGFPGEGNIILFDNGLFPRTRARVGQSIIYELNPPTGEVVWRYETTGYANMAFFSKTMGSQQRLPNGNTFISEDNGGRLFQVVPSSDHPDGGEIVWEYVSRASLSRCSMVPYDYTPQLRALPGPTEMRVTPPGNWYTRIKPDSQRKNEQDVFEFIAHDPEPKYPMTTGFTWVGFCLSSATVDELMLIQDVPMTKELAKAINGWSRDNGGFRKPEDLLKVPGMTKELYNKFPVMMDEKFKVMLIYTGKLKSIEKK